MALIDGLYRVDYGVVCAGFVIKNGRVTRCAPILRKRFDWWKRRAKRIGD